MITSLNHALEVWVIDLYAKDRLPDGVLTSLIAWHPGMRRRAAIIWSLLQEPQASHTSTVTPKPDLSFLSLSEER